MITWFLDTVYWIYRDFIYPLLDIGFWFRYLFNGEIPLALSLLIINSLFLILRLFDNGSGTNKDWNSGPSLVFQTGLIVGNIAVIALDASMRGLI